MREIPQDAQLVRVVVFPDAGADQIVEDGPKYHAYVSAPAQDGQANERMLRLLATELNVPRTSISILTGHQKPEKTVMIRRWG